MVLLHKIKFTQKTLKRQQVGIVLIEFQNLIGQHKLYVINFIKIVKLFLSFGSKKISILFLF